MNKKEQPFANETITIPIKDLLWLILGDESSGSPCNPVPVETASVLEMKIKDSYLYIMQWEDRDGVPLVKPKLWWRREHDIDSSTYARQKAYWHKEWVKDNLIKQNVADVAKAIMKKAKIPINDAMSMAFTIVSNPSSGAMLDVFFGVKELKTKEEDLV